MKNNKIMSIVIAVFISFTIVGCKSNDLKKSLEEGKKYLNSNEYEKAEESFENVLKDDKDNKEAKELIDVIKNYEESKSDYDSLKLEEARQAISKIPACYVDYGIKNDIEKLKGDIELKEKEKREAEEKAAKEEASKAQSSENKESEVPDSKSTSSNKSKKESTTNNKTKQAVNDKSKNKQGVSQKPITYVNKQKGFKIDLPASWKDHYEIKEKEGSIVIVFKSTKAPVKQGGLLVTISKNPDDGSFLDNATYKTVNGVNYVLGQPTDVGLDPSHPEFEIYSDMVREGKSINNTFRSAN